jgi:hypothetical protein
MKIILYPLDPHTENKLENYRKSLLSKAKELLMKDGWKRCNDSMRGKNVMVINDSGTVYHRYFLMDNDDEYYGNERYPSFFFTDDTNDYDDDICNTHLLLISDTIPNLTEFSKEAFELLGEYHESFESFDESILENF